ncbi:hypothetical protein BN130_1800 [Cronobacter malonaticus 507]|nr:hypothetical protein BN130_1800 [Cronobacter malonaticus 507]
MAHRLMQLFDKIDAHVERRVKHHMIDKRRALLVLRHGIDAVGNARVQRREAQAVLRILACEVAQFMADDRAGFVFIEQRRPGEREIERLAGQQRAVFQLHAVGGDIKAFQHPDHDVIRHHRPGFLRQRFHHAPERGRLFAGQIIAHHLIRLRLEQREAAADAAEAFIKHPENTEQDHQREQHHFDAAGVHFVMRGEPECLIADDREQRQAAANDLRHHQPRQQFAALIKCLYQRILRLLRDGHAAPTQRDRAGVQHYAQQRQPDGERRQPALGARQHDLACVFVLNAPFALNDFCGGNAVVFPVAGEFNDRFRVLLQRVARRLDQAV